jgi:hypothetical protein
LPKLDGWQVDLPNCWRCSMSFSIAETYEVNLYMCRNKT